MSSIGLQIEDLNLRIAEIRRHRIRAINTFLWAYSYALEIGLLLKDWKPVTACVNNLMGYAYASRDPQLQDIIRNYFADASEIGHRNAWRGLLHRLVGIDDERP